MGWRSQRFVWLSTLARWTARAARQPSIAYWQVWGCVVIALLVLSLVLLVALGVLLAVMVGEGEPVVDRWAALCPDEVIADD